MYIYIYIGSLDHWYVKSIINYLEELFILKLNFQKQKVVGGKTQFFVISPFVPPVLFFLGLGFEGQFFMEILIFICCTFNQKNSTSVFQKRLFVFCFLFFCVLFFCVYPVIVRKICPSLNPLKASLPSYRNESINLDSRPLTGFFMRATLVLDGLNRLLL